MDELSLGKVRTISADTVIRLIDGNPWKNLLSDPQILAVDFDEVANRKEKRI